MTDTIIIDGLRADTLYGLRVLKGSFSGLVAYPPRKPVKSNDWNERDGVEADLMTPAFDGKKLQMRLFCMGAGSARRFIDFMNTKAGKHTFSFGLTGERSFALRLTGISNLDYWQNGNAEMTLNLSEDAPALPYDITPAYLVGDNGNTEWVTLSGRGLTEYGVHVLKGTLASLLEKSELKEGLLSSSKYADGRLYHGTSTHFKAKDVQVECLLTAETASGFWAKYDTLLHDLIAPGELLLSFPSIGKSYKAYYKECSTVDIDISRRLWWQFRLTFTLTDYRP